MRLGRTAGWMLTTISVGLYAANVILAFTASSGKASGPGGALWPVPFLAMALLGAFVGTRRPRNAVGWLLGGAGLLMVANAVAQSYATYAMAEHVNLPATHLAAWLGFWLWMPAMGFIGLVLILFPTGRPRSAAWRWVVSVGGAVIAATCVSAIPTLAASSPALLTAPDPSALPHGAALAALSIGPLFALLPVGVIALVVRFIKAGGVERVQMKWLVFGAGLLGLATVIQVALVLLFNVEDPMGNTVGAGSVEIGATAIPVAAAIAILRYRLYDIDRIISRTLSYAVVTGLLAAAYIALVVVFQATTRPLTGRSDLAVAASTLIVAAMFIPLRRRVQNAVDHRFNRKRFDAEQTIDAFAARLRDEVDISTLSKDLEAVVRRTMQPVHVSMWIAGPATGERNRA